MESAAFEADQRWRRGEAAVSMDGTSMTVDASRLGRLSEHDPQIGALVRHLLQVAIRVLPAALSAGEFAFTLAGTSAPDGRWQLRPKGTSPRYATIATLGLLRLPAQDQRTLLGGEDCRDLVGRLAERLDEQTSRGDVALLCWAAAEAGHGELPHALARLAALDQRDEPMDVVSAAWIVTALVAARGHADVEQRLAAARDRLLAARAAVFPHMIGAAGPWYRSHVGCFADQVYPVQALARLHRSADDPEALAAADSVAASICEAQGAEGQWWWHYDARTGGVIEGYPVYSVHQHAMAPMALLDLADAGGARHLQAICRGLRWLTWPSETTERLILDDPPVIWRKVARGDRRKAVRGLRAAASRIRPGMRLRALDRMFRPGFVDHECRPYELGWLLLAWLPSLADLPAGPAAPELAGR
jgi:hypothetical protein